MSLVRSLQRLPSGLGGFTILAGQAGCLPEVQED